MIIDRERVSTGFEAYVSDYDISDPKVRLKVIHTGKVAALCDLLAQSLGLGGEDRDLAFLAGMLHDIGRFEQLRRFNTFRDSISVNHAALSADLLFGAADEPTRHAADSTNGLYGRDAAGDDRLIRRFVDDPSDDALLEKTIRLHNVYRLPEDLTDRERTFCQILRDADKIDILRVNRETPMTEIYDMPEEAFLTAPISEPVFADIMSCRDVNRANSRTAVDFLIGHIAFVFGLVYPESLRQVRQQGFLDQMLAFESHNPETARGFEQIRKAVNEYIDRKLALR